MRLLNLAIAITFAALSVAHQPLPGRNGKRDLLTAALHARVAARGQDPSATPTPSKYNTTAVSDAASSINKIFETLSQICTPAIQVIQGVINADPTQSAQQLRANPQYQQALHNITLAFQQAAVAAESMSSAPTGQKMRRQASDSSSQQLFTGLLQSTASLVNASEALVASAPVAGDALADIFSAINDSLSSLLATLNTTIGGLINIATGVLTDIAGDGSGALAL